MLDYLISVVDCRDLVQSIGVAIAGALIWLKQVGTFNDQPRFHQHLHALLDVVTELHAGRGLNASVEDQGLGP